jgi:hypothetical protein
LQTSIISIGASLYADFRRFEESTRELKMQLIPKKEQTKAIGLLAKSILAKQYKKVIANKY